MKPKLKPKTPALVGKKPDAPIQKRPETTVTKVGDGTIKLTHFRSVKQSLRYQTGDLSYGAEIIVHDTPKDVKAGIERIETLVSDALAEGIPEMRELLTALADQNDK